MAKTKKSVGQGKKKVSKKEKDTKMKEPETKEFLESVFNAITDGITVIDKNYNIIYINQSLAHFYGYKGPKEIIGKKCHKAFRDKKTRCKDCPTKDVFETGKPEHTIFSTEDHHKNELYWEIYFYPIYDDKGEVKSVVEYSRNITREKKLEEEIKGYERRLGELLSVSRDVIVEYDTKMNPSFIGGNIKDFTGYTKEEILTADSFYDFLTPKSKKVSAKIFKDRMAGKKVPKLYEIELIHKNGKIIPVEVQVSLKKEEGKVQSIVATARDITERKEAEKALLEREELYRTLVETSPDGIVLTDLDTNIIMTNPKGAKDMGYDSPEELIGMSAFDLMAQEDQPRIMENVGEMIEKGKVNNVEFNFVKKDGSLIPVEFNASLVYDEKGEPKAFLGISRNLSERRIAEEKLKESEEKFSNLFHQSNDAIILHDVKGNIVDANQRVLDIFGYSRKEILKLKIPKLHPPSELKKSEKAFKTISKKGFVNFEINFKKKNGDIFPAEVSSSLFEIGEKKVIQGIVRDITERKKVEEALKESEEMYRSLIKTSPDPITVTDLEGQITFVSDETLELSGFKKAKEVIGKNAFDFIAEEDKNRALKNLRKTIKQGVLKNAEYTMLRKDGTTYTGELSAAVIKDAFGKPKGFIATTRDITDRKKATEDLRYRLAFEELITTFSTHFIYLKTEEIDDGINMALKEIGSFADVDRSFVFLLHDEGKKFSNTHEWCADGIKSLKDQLQNLDVESFSWGIDRLKKLFPMDVPNVEELPKDASYYKKFLKKTKIKSLLAVPIVIESSLYGFVGFDSIRKKRSWPDDIISILHMVSEIFTNAFERIRSEEALRESEQKYRMLLDQSGDIITYFSPEGFILAMNHNAAEGLGGVPDDFLGKHISDMFQRDLADTSLKRIRRVAESLGSEEHEDIVELPTGIGWYRSHYHPMRDASGNVIGVQIISHDITQRKKAEEEVRELKEFNESIVQSMAEGIMILDEEGTVSFINPKVEKVLGYKSAKLIGNHWEDILATDFHRRMRDCFAENLRGEQDRFEAVLLKKNRTELPVLISASPQMKDGVFRGVLAVITDISERKREEIAREELMKYKIKKGSTYLIKEKELERGKDVVFELYKNHFKGLIITREHPEKIKREIDLNIPIFWMTKNPKDKASVKPEFPLLEKIIDDNIDRTTFVLLDRFDYLVTQNSFKEALNFVQHLNEIFYDRKATLIISLDPGTLNPQELSLLEKESSVLEKKLEERLSADLLDLLEFVNKRNMVGESPSYKHVGDGFRISRTTARKRIRELVDKGLIMERKSGRFKYLVLTEKGKEIL